MSTNEEIEAFLEHHGVRGMKWGVRRAQKRASKGPDRFGNRHQKSTQRKIDRVARVASGKASTSDMIRAGAFNIPLGFVVKEGFSLKGGAQAQLDSAQKLQKKVNAGKRSTTDMLLRLGGVDVREINYKYSTGSSSGANTKTAKLLNRNA